MINECLILGALVFVRLEGSILQPLSSVDCIVVVVSRLDFLRNGEDVRVGWSECAHAVDRGVHCRNVFLILLAESGYAISLSLVRKSHGERRGDGGGYDSRGRIGVVEVEFGGVEKLNNELWIKESACLLSQSLAARAQNVKGASESESSVARSQPHSCLEVDMYSSNARLALHADENAGVG